MNARRRHRVFLDHKPPLFAFALVVLVSMLLMVHISRSQAAPGWLRAGVGGAPAVGQRVVAGTLLERAASAPTTAAADAPLVSLPTVAAPAGDSVSVVTSGGGHADGTRGSHQPALAVADPVGPQVTAVGSATPDDPTDGPTDASSEDPAGDQGPGHRGDDSSTTPPPAVPTETGAAETDAPQPRDSHGWRDDWVGDRGHGHDGHHGGQGHGEGHGEGHGGQGHRGHGGGHGH